MRTSTKRLSATLGLCGALLCGGLTAAGPIYADTVTGPTGTTEVTVQTTGENIKFRVPTVIPFSVAADGDLTGPSPKDVAITNLSTFGIHVTNVKVQAVDDWGIAFMPSGSDKENVFNFTISSGNSNVMASAASGDSGFDLTNNPDWHMGYGQHSGSTLELTTSGSVAHVTKDLSSANKGATITWTVEPGTSTAKTQ